MLETDPGLPNSVFRLDRSLAQGNRMYPYSAFAYSRRVSTPIITQIPIYWCISAGVQTASALQQLAGSSRCRSSEA